MIFILGGNFVVLFGGARYIFRIEDEGNNSTHRGDGICEECSTHVRDED
jgi:hypothetical protein